MREILFRGKQIDNGEWVEGYLYEHEPPLQSIVPENYVQEPSRWFILKTAFADWNLPRQVAFIEVDPDTVGQYTGLTDKNGKKIFEGDICEMEICRGYPEPSPFLISIKNACVGYEPMFPERCHPDDREWRSFWDSEAEDMWVPEYFAVIGNIHDNGAKMDEEEAP